MKIQPARAEAFVRSPGSEICAVLVYGPDSGLVRERADALMRAAAEDPSDPFRTAHVSPEALKETPSLIADEAAALSLTGGRRAVRVGHVGDEATGPLEGFLADPRGDALVVVVAGDLPPRSKLRALCEKAANAAAVPCYRDEGRALGQVIEATLAADGVDLDDEAKSYLMTVLGEDRAQTRRELEKLALYVGPGAGRRATLNDVRACVGDSAELGLDDVVMAMGDGDLRALDRALERARASGVNPVSLLLAAARHLQRLHLAQGLVRAGASVDQAMGRLRPPVFWKAKSRFGAQVKAWPPDRLSAALRRLTRETAACMRTGAPAETLAVHTLFQVAGARNVSSRRGPRR